MAEEGISVVISKRVPLARLAGLERDPRKLPSIVARSRGPLSRHTVTGPNGPAVRDYDEVHRFPAEGGPRVRDASPERLAPLNRLERSAAWVPRRDRRALIVTNWSNGITRARKRGRGWGVGR